MLHLALKNPSVMPLSTFLKQLISQSCPRPENIIVSINEGALTSTEWTEYTGTVRRIRKSTIPISDITAETVATDGVALRQADHTGVTQRFSRAYRADGMVLVATDCRNNTLVTQQTYSYDTLGRPLTHRPQRHHGE